LNNACAVDEQLEDSGAFGVGLYTSFGICGLKTLDELVGVEPTGKTDRLHTHKPFHHLGSETYLTAIVSHFD
jgi:hypothetical protein